MAEDPGYSPKRSDCCKVLNMHTRVQMLDGMFPQTSCILIHGGSGLISLVRFRELPLLGVENSNKEGGSYLI